MLKTLRHTLLLVLLVTGIALSVSAQTSVQFPYQGQLTDNSGAPLSGSYDLNFAIYDVATGGTPLWNESHSAVSVVNGLFTVQLGSTVTLTSSLFDGGSRYLGVTVGSDSELSPRTRLGAAPYASRAASVDGFSPGSSNTITGQNGFVAGDSNTVLTDFSTIAGGIGNLVDLTNIADSTFDTTGLFNAPVFGSFDPSGNSAGRDIALYPCNYPPSTTPVFIGGGFGNTAIGNGSGIGFGGNNTAWGGFSAIVGGGANYAEGDFSFIGGGFCNQALVQGRYQVIGGGYRNHAYGTVTTIGGGAFNSVALNFTGITIAGGFGNRANNHVSTIGGGYLNTVDGFGATIAGGQQNQSLNSYSTVAGGRNNVIIGSESTIGGGLNNRVEGQGSTIAGGENNLGTLHPHQFIGGGLGNHATDPLATISGGQENVASTWATVGGGVLNQAVNEYTFIGGGHDNTTNGHASMVGGGIQNVSGGYTSVISGGGLNHVFGAYGVIAGGYDNFAQADTTFIGGGAGNVAGSSNATVGGGQLNGVNAIYGSILGGRLNAIVGPGGAIGGGESNRVGPGSYSTIPGGLQNSAISSQSFAAGTKANANDDCSFVWSDCCVDTVGVPIHFSSFIPRTFNARASNGFYFMTGCDSVIAPGSGQPGVFVPAGGSMWTSLSSRTMKKNIVRTNDRSILEKVATLPIYHWTYNSQNNTRHIGPMAEDFYATFGVGESDKTISTLDPAGVALSAIKELHKKVAEIDNLKKQLNDVNTKMARMEAQIVQILATQNKSTDGNDELASK